MTRDALFDAAALTRLRRVSSASPSPCGRYLALSVLRLDADESAYVSDLWRVSIDDPSAPPLQLTRGSSKDVAPQYRCDGSLAFLSNRNPRDGKPEEGDEERQQAWLGAFRFLRNAHVGVGALARSSHGATMTRCREERMVFVAVDQCSLGLTDRQGKKDFGPVGTRCPRRRVGLARRESDAQLWSDDPYAARLRARRDRGLPAIVDRLVHLRN